MARVTSGVIGVTCAGLRTWARDITKVVKNTEKERKKQQKSEKNVLNGPPRL